VSVSQSDRQTEIAAPSHTPPPPPSLPPSLTMMLPSLLAMTPPLSRDCAMASASPQRWKESCARWYPPFSSTITDKPAFTDEHNTTQHNTTQHKETCHIACHMLSTCRHISMWHSQSRKENHSDSSPRTDLDNCQHAGNAISCNAMSCIMPCNAMQSHAVNTTLP
jgi:hypothetical protein